MAPQLRVNVPAHPLIRHWLAVSRNVATPNSLFRTAMTELGRWLTYEAMRDEVVSRWLPTLETTIETPLAPCSATFIDPEIPIVVVPILRAGLALLEGAQTLLPLASIYHIGFARNEETLEATCYMNKLPEQFDPQTRVLISEPMLATGGTIMATMAELTQRGVDPALIRIIAVVTAPPALQKLGMAYPNLNIYTAAIDESLNQHGFIVPGLGDAGDRTFGT
ncbi:uracil phosphoribosyltransferase [Leptolyngbya sp. 'hensonii']|uniref:uracil phosphoribosyltransferase n=1 Tax=Leptolyngbya sp. 'hensonii' TaxID=1922337 RepID=UPI00094F9F7B|nr:uracil phosphoribosyltransferase [Leptolyngbya sp. 'hensonii']OLP19282.1 uracil phosphoribosyltransferase [Leptolyngbya sp. 'hensonii']